MSIFSRFWDWIKSLSPAGQAIISTADKLVNELKVLEASDAGQFLEGTIEAVVPASTGLVNAFKLWLPVVVTDLNWVVVEEGKTDAQKIADAVAYLKQLKISNPDAYAGQLNTLNALIQKWMSDNQGEGITMPQALAISQINHSSDLLEVS